MRRALINSDIRRPQNQTVFAMMIRFVIKLTHLHSITWRHTSGFGIVNTLFEQVIIMSGVYEWVLLEFWNEFLLGKTHFCVFVLLNIRSDVDSLSFVQFWGLWNFINLHWLVVWHSWRGILTNQVSPGVYEVVLRTIEDF